ncbi:MAG: hypothetical protein ABIP49_09970 [Lysobacterales bacterium]
MNMFKGLLFLHGHSTRPEDLDDAPASGRAEYGARTAANDFVRPLGNRAASSARFGRDTGKSTEPSSQTVSRTRNVQPVRMASPRKPAGFLAHLLYLGGRPMHAGHNLDIEEPFEQLASEDDIAAHARRRARASARRVGSTQTCTG